jgi:malate synthase
MDKMRQYAERVEFTAPIPDEFSDVLTPEAVAFVAKLSRDRKSVV